MNQAQKEQVWRQLMRDIDRHDHKRIAKHLAAGFLAGFGLALLITKGD